MAYKIYRMYRGKMVFTGPGSGFFGQDLKPTAHIFKGRSQNEAQRKMDKFLREARICGSFCLKEIA